MTVLRALAQLSDRIANYESSTAAMVTLEEEFAALNLDEIPKVKSLMDARNKLGPTSEVKDAIKESYDGFRALMVKFCDSIEPDKRRRGRMIRRGCPSRTNPEITDIDAAIKWGIPLVMKALADMRMKSTRQGEDLKSTLALLAQTVNGVY